jgi:hypothetical protein
VYELKPPTHRSTLFLRLAATSAEDRDLLELPKQFRFPGPGAVDRYVGDPVRVGGKLDAILIQHSDVISSEAPIKEPHIEDDVLAGAWMEVVLRSPTYIVLSEQDHGPARLGRVPFELLNQRLTPIRLFVENDRLTSAFLVDRASDLFADEFVVAMDHNTPQSARRSATRGQPVGPAYLPANPRAELKDDASGTDQLPVGRVIVCLGCSGLYIEH